jgi:hypothetical protein
MADRVHLVDGLNDVNWDADSTALFKVIKAYSGFTGGAGDFTINETY